MIQKEHLLFLMSTLFFLITIKVDAVSPTATPSADIKNKLQSLQQEIASRASKIKSEIGKKLQNRVYIGFVKSKSDTSLTLASKNGSKLVNLNQDTQYLSEVKTKIKFTLKNITNDDYLVALGDMDDTEVITAKRIIKLAPPSENILQTIWGVVTETGDKFYIKTNDDKLFSITTSSKTTYQFGDDEGEKSNLKTQKPIIVIGDRISDKEIKARFIYILPYTLSVKSQIATISATPTASVSGQTKLSPSPTNNKR